MLLPIELSLYNDSTHLLLINKDDMIFHPASR